MPSIDLTGLDASLKSRRDGARTLFKGRMTDGWGRIKGFQRLRTADELVLGKLTGKKLLQPGAKGTFNPTQNALKIEARIAKVRPGKIDLLIGQAEAKQLESTYWAQVEGHQAKNPEDYMFADHVWEFITEQTGVDVMEAVWKGELNSAGTTPIDVVNGLVTLMNSDIESDDIPETSILIHSDNAFYLQESNIIEEFKNLARIYRTRLPNYANAPAILYCAPERAAEYEMAVFEQHGDKKIYDQFNQVILFFAKNIRIEPVIELAGTDFCMITPDDNLVFVSDRTEDGIQLDTDYSKRDRSIAIVGDLNFATNYHRSDLIICNDLRARPANTGV